MGWRAKLKADGNPIPLYMWRRSHKIMAYGPQMTLTEAAFDADKLHSIECVAQNQLFARIKQSSATINITISGN